MKAGGLESDVAGFLSSLRRHSAWQPWSQSRGSWISLGHSRTVAGAFGPAGSSTSHHRRATMVRRFGL